MAQRRPEIANQGNYGIDAPTVIRNLAWIGVLPVVAGILLLCLHGVVWSIAAGLLFLGGLVCWVEVLLMLWSSKWGKGIVIRKLIEQLDIGEHDRILDVGCGRGFVLNALAKQISSGKAIGIDIWNPRDQSGNDPKVTLHNAELEGIRSRVEVIHADARKLPFDNDTFDKVVSSLVIHNIQEPKERRKAIEEMVRVLKGGGQAAILDFQHAREYARYMADSGLRDVRISALYVQMFPPVRIVTGIKK
ncbi:class I SAM-dependent methyltransferase [Paenibacillus sp. OAE614]|uniref:class I SAM-dependent methyltransferase n=1 Tax=Paenibacillus sp. OAE614 TaxID=2663804 RepID=UPI00178B3E0A